MNYFTSIEQFLEPASYILEHSDLIDKDECIILDNVLYEKCDEDDGSVSYRFFFSVDDYDYIEDVPENKDILAKLNDLFE